jgi:hypothetical protein
VSAVPADIARTGQLERDLLCVLPDRQRGTGDHQLLPMCAAAP